MQFVYTLGIYFTKVILVIVGLLNPKIKAGVQGRKNTFNKLRSVLKSEDEVFWFHCASLGEYEQGLPVFKELRNMFSKYKIVLSFFSPSGYEIRKNSPIADVVIYLPLDTPHNAKLFIDIVRPSFSIFVKYEIWPNYLKELSRLKLPVILISALFREKQIYFRWYGGLMRNALKSFNHIFTQNENSKKLIGKIGIENISVAGDTRFDRVSSQLLQDNSIDFIEDFLGDARCIVFGSTWPEDDKLYLEFINKYSKTDLKFIIAPHNIKTSYINSLKSQLLVPYICYSQLKKGRSLKNHNVFIIDVIGYLTKVYSYASIAYVGGAAGTTGLHNILEPAVFGIPIIIGKNYDRFPEAQILIEKGGVFSVKNKEMLLQVFNSLLLDERIRNEKGRINLNFIENNKGAVIQIIDYIRTYSV